MAILIVSCASEPKYKWVKPGATDAEAATAMRACGQRVAEALGFSEGRPDALIQNTAAFEDELFASCMQAAGYRRVRSLPPR